MALERINYLVDRFLDGSITEEEKEELAVWTDQSADEEAVRQVLEMAWLRHEPNLSMPVGMSDRIQHRLYKEGPALEAPAAKPRTGTPLISGRIDSRKWWAAAAILLLTCGGLYLLSRLPAKQQIAHESRQSTHDVSPGGNKAVLTLGNGHRIILDSAADGVLAQQGNATVTKLSSGQLAYKLSKAGADGSGPATASFYNTMSTPRGGQYKLSLPDGTAVWLNSASSITFPAAFSGKERDVSITGEVYFEVAKNKTMPFRVRTGNVSVNVLGTHFNINAYQDETSINTTLLEGAVSVVSMDHSQVLAPGQQGQVNPTGSIALIPHADTEQAVAWKDGIFSFRDADIRTVMRQLSRWYNVEVAYTGELPKGSFSGEIGRTLTLAQVLKGLAQTRVHYTIENGNKILILP